MGNYRSKLMFTLGPIQTPVNLNSAVPASKGDVHLYCPIHKARVTQFYQCEQHQLGFYELAKGIETPEGVRLVASADRPKIPPSQSINFRPVPAEQVSQRTLDTDGVYYCSPSIEAGKEAWAIFAKIASDPSICLVARASLTANSQKLFRLGLFNGYLTLRGMKFPEDVRPHPEMIDATVDPAIWGLVSQFVSQQMADWDAIDTENQVATRLADWAAGGELLPNTEPLHATIPNMQEALRAAVERTKGTK